MPVHEQTLCLHTCATGSIVPSICDTSHLKLWGEEVGSNVAFEEGTRFTALSTISVDKSGHVIHFCTHILAFACSIQQMNASMCCGVVFIMVPTYFPQSCQQKTLYVRYYWNEIVVFSNRLEGLKLVAS